MLSASCLNLVNFIYWHTISLSSPSHILIKPLMSVANKMVKNNHVTKPCMSWLLPWDNKSMYFQGVSDHESMSVFVLTYSTHLHINYNVLHKMAYCDQGIRLPLLPLNEKYHKTLEQGLKKLGLAVTDRNLRDC